uniref:Uncharacterized protein n=1 Tax=Globisporangium ultimum (strain ATCC 200006 / CBS 805.95 / DAOM BR144) TaxID=431595 RepID=K3WKG5_GLOUD
MPTIVKYAPSMKKLPLFMRSSTNLNEKSTPESASIPREFLLRDLKEKRKFRLLSRKLTVFVTFMVVYLAVLLMDRNISGRKYLGYVLMKQSLGISFLSLLLFKALMSVDSSCVVMAAGAVVRRIISKELIDSSHAASGMTFAGINSVGAFWDWFTNSFLDSVYTTTNSDGLPRSSDEMYTIASHTKIVGGFHLIQKRYTSVNTSSSDHSNDPCYSYLEPTVNQTCFSAKGESTDSFGAANGTKASEAELLTLEMFQYSTNNDSVGGFQTYFLRSTTDGDAELVTVKLMRSYRWIDRQTSSVEITMPMYNSNLKIWSVVNLNIGFDLAGGVTPKSFIHVTNIEPYNLSSTKNVVRVALEGVFILHVIYFALLEFWDLCVLSSGSVRTYVMRYGLINNLGDWSNIFINMAIIAWRYGCQSNSTRLSMLVITSFDEYVSALSLAQWDEVLLVLNVCNMLLLTGRALKYFQVTNGGRRLMSSVYGAMPEVLSFLPIYFSVLIGYTFVGHMLYGLSFPEWSTFPRAFFRVFELNFGLYDPGAIYDAGGYLSAIFIYTANTVFCILMLNVFMAIVMSTWDNLSDREAEKTSERETYSRKLGAVDMMFLIFMKEDVVDLLIDVAIDLEGYEMVSKETFTHGWKMTGIEVSPWTWGSIVSWYWGTESSGPFVDKQLAQNTTANRLEKAAPTKSVTETSDDVANVSSAQDLDSTTSDSIVAKSVEPKQQSWRSAIKPSSSAKVFAAIEEDSTEGNH